MSKWTWQEDSAKVGCFVMFVLLWIGMVAASLIWLVATVAFKGWK